MPAFIFILALFLCNVIGCRKTETGPTFTGRLEIDGICGNYTITVLQGELDTTQVQANWTDPNTGIAYTNVFGLSDPCGFPDLLKAGDTFSFRIKSPNNGCVQCLAFYPTPAKSLSIQVIP